MTSSHAPTTPAPVGVMGAGPTPSPSGAQARTNEGAKSTGATVLGGAVVTTALLAGLYYGFTVAVMPGLRDADDRAFVAGMQGINNAIVNPAFMVAFAGAPVLTALAAWRAFRAPEGSAARRGARLVLAALVLHLAGLALTIGGNVPLNDALKAAGAAETLPPAELAEARAAFEQPWTRRHLLRTGFTAGALVCLTGAALVTARETPARRPG